MTRVRNILRTAPKKVISDLNFTAASCLYNCDDDHVFTSF